MSRGFVREGDQEEVPIVPQRAYLPVGVPNFVTPSGMELLLAEKKLLINERDHVVANNENERRIAVNFINAKLQILKGLPMQGLLIRKTDLRTKSGLVHW